MKLKNKTAIITGASSGIGEATAKALSMEGAKIILAARRLDRLEAIKSEIEKSGGTAIAVRTDVVNRDEVENLANVALKEFGRIDILINNAGLMPLSFVKNLHVEEWERMVDVNLKGVLYAIAAVLPNMRKNKSGDIVNISSIAGRKLFPGAAVYCATKFGVTALSEGMRMELSAKENIRITSIEPGAVATELTHTITDQELLDQWSDGRRDHLVPLKPEDIAKAIVYALAQPPEVSVNEILIQPTSQGL
ncbi:MAG: oxidoreductase [Bacteroidetes bacterium 4484_276]|nr:MAG: oxidoreductase [Bacteroidetes bacterium 4484_276]